MDKITIYHSSSNDSTGQSFRSFFKRQDSRLIWKSKVYSDFLECFSSLGIFPKDTIITIVSRNYLDRGITTEEPDSFVSWAELIYLINEKKNTNKKIILNLVGISNSATIEKMIPFCNHGIDEFWVTIEDSIVISVAELAADSENFNSFCSHLDDDKKKSTLLKNKMENCYTRSYRMTNT